MKMRYLRYFLTVAEEQSFVRAAARVNIEPSPLSRTIKELEQHLGVGLLQRSKGRIRLTWAGEIFCEEARRVLMLVENAKTRVHAASQGYRGRLRIGLADNLAQPKLTQLLARCREEEPRTEVRIMEMTVGEMFQALGHDLIDVGLTVDDAHVTGCIKQVLWSDRPCIAIPTHHPLLTLDVVPLRELRHYPLILSHPEKCTGGHHLICRWFYENAMPVPAVAEFVSGHEPMMLLVAAGYGIGIGLESQLALYCNPDVIIRPVSGKISLATTFLVVADSPLSQELDRFIQRAHRIGGTSRPQA